MNNVVMQTITKADLIIKIQEKIEIATGKETKKSQVKRDFESCIECIADSVVNGVAVRFRGVGVLVVRYKDGGRPVRNPKSGEKMKMPDTYSIRMTPTAKISSGKICFSELIEKVSHIIGSHELAKIHLVAIKEEIRSITQGNKRIEIRGFGVFYPSCFKARTDRTPATGESVEVDEQIKVTFKQSTLLIQQANENLMGDVRSS